MYEITFNQIILFQSRTVSYHKNDIEVDNWIFGSFPLIYWPRKDEKLLIILKSRLRSFSFINRISTSFQILYWFPRNNLFYATLVFLCIYIIIIRRSVSNIIMRYNLILTIHTFFDLIFPYSKCQKRIANRFEMIRLYDFDWFNIDVVFIKYSLNVHMVHGICTLGKWKRRR